MYAYRHLAGNVGDPEAVPVVPATPQGLHRQAEAQRIPEPARDATGAGHNRFVAAWTIRGGRVPGNFGPALASLFD